MSRSAKKYRTPIKLQQFGGDQLVSDFDPPESQWVDVFPDRAAFEGMRPTEMESDGQLHAGSVVKIHCRWSRRWQKAMQSGRRMRIVTEGTTYAVRSIVDVDEMHRQAEITCDRTQSEAVA